MPKTPIPALAGIALALLAVSGCGSSSSSSSTTAAAPTPAKTAAFITPLKAFSTVASTVPTNGDVNPYGIAFVPASVGKLKAGHMLISNFNAKESAKQSGQGTGTTIVQVSTAGQVTPFATIDANSLPGPCPGGVGLTTALNILPGGYVVVGSLPTTNGKSATAQYGCLIVLNSEGKAIKTIASKNIQGPWDSTAKSEGAKTTLFVSNALNGGAVKGEKTVNNSTVLRIDLESGEEQPPKVLSETVVAQKIPWVDSPEALVLGPTGLALASNGTLYVASTQNNQILAISEAATRTTPLSDGTVLTEGGHLKEPLGMVLAPNGNIITTNGGDGNMVETTPQGQQIAVQTADKKTGAGSLFGLAISPSANSIYYVDDGENTLNLLHAGANPAPTPTTTSSAASATHAPTPTPTPSKPSTTPAPTPTPAPSKPSTTHTPAAPPTTTTNATQPAAATPSSSSGEAKLSLEANPEGQLKFNKTTLTANASKVSIDFTNMAPLSHNLTVASASGAVVGATPTFQGGTKTLALNLKPGTYTYYCSVPGHRMAGMEGKLIVK